MKQAGIPLKNAVPVFKPKGPALPRVAQGYSGEIANLANPVTIDNPPPYQCFPNPIGVTGLVAYRTLTVQTPLAQPYPIAIPHQQFHPGTLAITEDIRHPVAGRTTPTLLNPARQTIDPGSHVHRFPHQPDLPSLDHRARNRSDTHCADNPSGTTHSHPREPRITTPPELPPDTRTGTSVNFFPSRCDRDAQ